MVLGRTPLIVDAEMRVLVINSGSSSIKFRLVDLVEESTGGLAVRPAVRQGTVKGIGSTASFELIDGQTHRSTNSVEVRDHAQALRVIFDGLADTLGGIEAVGHRVVHGGERYRESVLITDQVEADIDALSELAPLHNPPSLAAIRGTRKMVGASVPMVAVFDTAFHHTLPSKARIYALPHELAARHRIRRYGFHGLSYEYIASVLPDVAPEIAGKRIIVAHLGSGASMCAMKGGKGVDNTLGFTALDGLCMGTRPGALDPGVVLYLFQNRGLSVREVESILYKKSGLLAISGVSNDMRELLASSDPRASLAVDYFVYRVAKEIGALTAVLGGIDGFVFTAGIGENSAEIRRRICEASSWLGIQLDTAANERRGPRISSPQSKVPVWVIPTNEELMIARHTGALLGLLEPAHTPPN